MKGYCMKCRSEREMVGIRVVTMKNGRPATEGRCPACDTRLFRLGRPARVTDVQERPATRAPRESDTRQEAVASAR